MPGRRRAEHDRPATTRRGRSCAVFPVNSDRACFYYESSPRSNNVSLTLRRNSRLKIELTNDATRGTSIPRCRLCGGCARPAMQKDSFSIVRCDRCGFMFAMVPAATDTEKIYTDDEFFFS